MVHWNRHFVAWACIVGASAPLLLSGCGGNSREDVLRDLNGSNAQRLSNLYCEYQTQNAWRGPRDEDSFREFIAGLPVDALTVVGVDPAKLDALFVSERDEKPFRVRYKVTGSPYSSQPVVFEETGVEGKRAVGYTNGQIVEVESDSEYDALFEAKAGRARDENTGRGIPMDANTGG